MKSTRKLTYTATCTAIAIASIALSYFLPIKITPLMVCALCFFIAHECGLYYGFLCIATALLLNFFLFGGLNATFFITAFLVAPYSLTAFFLKKLSYEKFKKALLRAGIVFVFFNISLAVIIFGFGDYLTEFLFGFSLDEIFLRLGSKTGGYLILAGAGSVLMAGFDYIFIMAYTILKKRLKFK